MICGTWYIFIANNKTKFIRYLRLMAENDKDMTIEMVTGSLHDNSLSCSIESNVSELHKGKNVWSIASADTPSLIRNAVFMAIERVSGDSSGTGSIVEVSNVFYTINDICCMLHGIIKREPTDRSKGLLVIQRLNACKMKLDSIGAVAPICIRVYCEERDVVISMLCEESDFAKIASSFDAYIKKQYNWLNHRELRK